MNRNSYYIAVRSVTYAQSALRVLRAANLRVRQVRSPAGIENSGCGHALAVQDIDGALRALAAAGLPPFRVYRTEDGKTPLLYRDPARRSL